MADGGDARKSFLLFSPKGFLRILSFRPDRRANEVVMDMAGL